MPDKSAIRSLMDEVAAGRSLQHLYDCALSCLRRTLGVERAAVLVLDEQRVMRFVAWSRLSDDYRRAADGHSPWSPDETDARPVLVRDVAAAPDLAAYLPVFEVENVRALAFIPLRFGPKLLGKFMLYYAEPHELSQDELAMAEIIAGHVAFAVEHRRIAAELEARAGSERALREQAEQEAALRQENERRLHLALAAGQMGAWSWDLATDRVLWSQELEAIHGLAPGTFGGDADAFRRDVHLADRRRLDAAVRRAREHPHRDFEIEYRILPPSGGLRWVSLRGRVLSDDTGRPVRMVGICGDVTKRKRVEETEAFVAQASLMLATTLEPGEAVQRLASIVVPRLADWCLIQILDEHGRLTPLGLSHVDPAKKDLGWRLARDARNDIGSNVVRTGESRLIPRIGADMLAARAADAEALRRLEALGLCSAITVPLAARGRILGTLSLISAESRRVYGEDDLRFAEEIGSWAALSLDNAQLFRHAEEACGKAEEARRRLQTLAELSSELASSLDP